MNTPKTIYLQWTDDIEDEVTWCVDKNAEEGKTDVEYIRADIVDDLLKACEASSFALKSYQYGNQAVDLAKEVSKFCDTAIAKAKDGEG